MQYCCNEYEQASDNSGDITVTGNENNEEESIFGSQTITVPGYDEGNIFL
jgi:hypothetical protein